MLPAFIAVGLALSSLVFAVTVQQQPLVALALPMVAITAILWMKFPLAGAVCLLVVSGTYGSVQAFTGVSVGPVADLAIGGLLVYFVLTLLFRRREPTHQLWPGMVALGLLVFLTFVEIFTSDGIGLGLRSFRLSAWFMLIPLLIGYAGWRASTYERFGKAVVAVAALVGAYATLRWLLGPAAAEQSNANASAGYYNFIGDKLQVVGSFPSRQELGFWVATMIPFCLICALGLTGRWRAVGALGVLGCAIGLLGSHVRTGAAAAVVGVAVVVLLYQASSGFRGLHLGTTALVIVGLLGVGGGVYAATVGSSGETESPYSAILNPGNDESYVGRRQKWNDAIRDIGHHPLGSGLGTAGRLQEQRAGPYLNAASYGLESSYLKVAFEQGFGVMAFLIGTLLAIVVGLARRAIVTTDPTRATFAIGASGALATAMTMFITNQYIEGLICIPMWVSIGVAVGMFNAMPGSASGRP